MQRYDVALDKLHTGWHSPTALRIARLVSNSQCMQAHLRAKYGPLSFQKSSFAPSLACGGRHIMASFADIVGDQQVNPQHLAKS